MRKFAQQTKCVDRHATVAARKTEHVLDAAELERVAAAAGPMGGVIGKA